MFDCMYASWSSVALQVQVLKIWLSYIDFLRAAGLPWQLFYGSGRTSASCSASQSPTGPSLDSQLRSESG